MLWDLIRSFRAFANDDVTSMEMAALLAQFAGIVFVLIFGLSFHEFAHAWAAKKLGDNTAYNHGRLTLNPGKHLDPIGSLLILVVGYGYAKPVPVNPRNFKHYKKGMALTAVAGPIANLIMAFVFAVFANAAHYLSLYMSNEFVGLIKVFLWAIVSTNISLAVFNLLPIPPLDGSRILDLFLPYKASRFLEQYGHYIMYGTIALLVLGVFNIPLGFVSTLIYRGIDFITWLPFRLLP